MKRQLFRKGLRQSVLLGAMMVLVALLAPRSAPADIYVYGDIYTAGDLVVDDTLHAMGTINITCQNEIFGSTGQGTLNQSTGTNTVHESLYLGKEDSASGTFNLTNVDLSVDLCGYIGYAGTGTFNQSGGTTTIHSNLFLGEASTGSGTYNLSSGSLLAPEEIIGKAGTGTFTQSGGTNTVTNLVLASDPGSRGSYNLEGGSLSAGSLQVNTGGAFQVTGVANKLTTTVTADVANAGTVKTSNAEVTWTGAFTNNGAYESDSSTQTFNTLVVGSTGYLVAASQDIFLITENFENRSTQNTLWDTAMARLEFDDGKCGLYNLCLKPRHTLYIPGEDLGPTSEGFDDNFAWGAVDFNKQTVALRDGSGTDGGALYVEEIAGLLLWGDLRVVLNIRTSWFTELNIYYDASQNPDLGGLTYSFLWGRGHLIPVTTHTPLPASVLLLGSGLLGLGLLGRRRKKS